MLYHRIEIHSQVFYQLILYKRVLLCKTLATLDVDCCRRNIAGRQLFKAAEEPTYSTAFRAIMICYALMVCLCIHRLKVLPVIYNRKGAPGRGHRAQCRWVIARQEQLTAHESVMEQFSTEEKAMKGLIPGDDCFIFRALTALCELQNYLAGCCQDFS